MAKPEANPKQAGLQGTVPPVRVLGLESVWGERVFSPVHNCVQKLLLTCESSSRLHRGHDRKF